MQRYTTPDLAGLRIVEGDGPVVPDEMAPEDILQRIGVPTRFIRASWESWDPPAKTTQFAAAQLERFREWRGADPSETMVTLTGPPGVGKTHLATATLRRFVEGGKRGGRWIAVSRMVETMREEVAGRVSGALMPRLISASLLILDDLGAQRETDWTLDRLYLLLSERYNELRPTVITTNLSLDQIGERIDARIASRLVEGLVVPMRWDDHRKPNKRGGAS